MGCAVRCCLTQNTWASGAHVAPLRKVPRVTLMRRSDTVRHFDKPYLR